MDEFTALYRGERAVCSFAEARLEVAHWLGQSPLALDLSVPDAAWAIEATRSWFEMGFEFPDRPPAPCVTAEVVRDLLNPPKGRGGTTREAKVTPNRLWTKKSY